MDPNEVLAQMRRSILLMQEAEGDASFMTSAAELLDAAEALDGWLSKGGFLPREWGVRA